jgi:hypothetical protein
MAATAPAVHFTGQVEKWRQVAVGIKRGVRWLVLFVARGLSYIASASCWDGEQRKSFSGSVGPFIVSQETGPLKLVVSAGR